MRLEIALAALVFGWGVWDYYHSEHPSSTAFVKAWLGLGVIIILIVRSLT